MSAASPYRGLRLAVFQVRPLRAGAAQDGSQAILMDMLRHFGTIGVTTTMYCGRAPDLPAEVALFPGVTVRPVLGFAADSPELYRATPYDLVDVIDAVRRACETHDVLYIHDSNLRFMFAGAERPVATALFDLVYGHSLAGGLAFERDRLIAISDYVGACLREVFRRFRPLDDAALHVVNSGFAADRFRQRDPGAMRARLGLTHDAIAVLCPHRPEPGKGLHDAIHAVALLRERLSPAVYDRVRLLVPDWYGDDPLSELPEARAQVELLGVADRLHPHPWIPRADMGDYYGIGAATLCLGTFPEAFGNVHIESMLAGTPAILSRVAAQRTTVPEEMARKVDPGDVDAAADHLAEVISSGERTHPELRRHLHERFGLARMLRGYERALLECERRPVAPLAPPPGPVTAATRLRVPPWAARLARGYYHDYTGYSTDDGLARCLDRIALGRTAGELTADGKVTLDDVRRWLRDGLLVSDPVAGHL